MEPTKDQLPILKRLLEIIRGAWLKYYYATYLYHEAGKQPVFMNRILRCQRWRQMGYAVAYWSIKPTLPSQIETPHRFQIISWSSLGLREGTRMLGEVMRQ